MQSFWGEHNTSVRERILLVYCSINIWSGFAAHYFSVWSLIRSESKHVFFCFSLTCESIYFGSQPLHHISKPKLTEYLDRQSSSLTFLSEPQPSKGSMLPFLAHSLHRNYMLSNWATSTMR